MDKPYSRNDWKQLIEVVREQTVHMGGYYEEAVRSIFFWSGPDNHPENWNNDWEFFHGDKGLYPEKRAFIGWCAATGWEREGDDGFDHFEIRSRNIQAIKTYRDNNDWQTTEVRTRLINREEDLEWIRTMFLKLWNEAYPERDEPPVEITKAEFDVPDHFPSYVQPSTYQ